MNQAEILLEIIKKRRSIRKYKDKPVEDEKIKLILESARWAPSSGNLQNWYFYVVKNREKIREIAKACYGQMWIATAPIVIVVCSDREEILYYGERGLRLYSIQNTAAAIENMLLMATALGLGTCWVGAFSEEKIREILGIPEKYDIHAVITLGYPDEEPLPRPRKRLEEIYEEIK